MMMSLLINYVDDDDEEDDDEGKTQGGIGYKSKNYSDDKHDS